MLVIGSSEPRKENSMDMNVDKEVATLKRMTVPQLREKYREVFGDGTRARHKAFLIKRIIWRKQALAEGDLSERARRRADELANDADLRLGPPKAKPQANGSTGRVATAMWNAAMESKSCRLTALGEHYRRLAERNRI